MNIDAYKHHVHVGLRQLATVIAKVNDIIEHRIEKNLLVVSKTRLVCFRENAVVSLEDFVVMQEQHIQVELEVRWLVCASDCLLLCGVGTL
jgi:dynein heavy chain